MKLLAIDTSGAACTVAVLYDEACVAAFEMAPQRHAERVLPMADALLAEAGLSRGDLDAVAFGRGPGAFTGVRIAAAVAQGMAFALDLPVIAVSSLATLAEGVRRERGAEAVLAAFDARMGEVYWGAYRAGEGGVMRSSGEERVIAPARLEHPGPGPWAGAGDGWGAHGACLTALVGAELTAVEPDRFPHARDLARLAAVEFAAGRTLAPELAVPVYLRERVV